MTACYVARPTADGQSHEFLQLCRRAGDYMAGAWTTVYGTSSEGETAWQAALRELREESGLSPREFYQLDFVQTFYTALNDTLWHAIPFIALVARQDELTLNEEHSSHRWVTRDRVDELFLWESDRASIRSACRDILDGSSAKQHLKIEVKDG